uniref:Uncharacterized protein n=1 Tax=Knipowitschia caucasica TaxID=637954 RepID=A0AAV2JPA5_KNICA
MILRTQPQIDFQTRGEHGLVRRPVFVLHGSDTDQMAVLKSLMMLEVPPLSAHLISPLVHVELCCFPGIYPSLRLTPEDHGGGLYSVCNPRREASALGEQSSIRPGCVDV